MKTFLSIKVIMLIIKTEYESKDVYGINLDTMGAQKALNKHYHHVLQKY